MNEEDCQNLLDYWQNKYIGFNTPYPDFIGFANLGNKTRGITTYRAHYKYNREDDTVKKTEGWGEIKLNSKLKADWRIKAVSWHEFCHHWAYSVFNYTQHQGRFDDCLRTNKVLWLLGSLSRIIPMF